MNRSVTEFYDEQPEAQYERSHGPRFDFLVKDLGLDKITNSRVGDFGCGYGPIFLRMGFDKGNQYFGWDGADIVVPEEEFWYYRQDLSASESDAEELLTKPLDYAFCFETIEHLTNPYNCLVKIKSLLKLDGILYLSVPHESITHNTIYPGLLYPVQNFKEFLGQMAFEIERHVTHDKAFKQHVFTLKNKDWNHSKMKWFKGEEKFRNISPQEAVNL